MHILALETTGAAGTVAAALGPRLLANSPLNPRQRSAQSLVPAIRQIIDAVGWRMSDIELIAVVKGPGSFTSLRVGLATAKTLAYALRARLVALDTLAVIAAQAPILGARLHVTMDAGRGELFAAEFEPTGRDPPLAWQAVSAPHLIDRQHWLSILGPSCAVTGPALAKFTGELPEDVIVTGQEMWSPQAATLAGLAWHRHLAGSYDDVWKLAPLYLRKSAAEEKLERS